MKKDNIDVTIYLANIKNFLDKNSEAAEYFFGKDGADEFYKLLKLVALQNFDESGDPALTMDQFEEIREATIVKHGTNSIPEILKTFYFSIN